MGRRPGGDGPVYRLAPRARLEFLDEPSPEHRGAVARVTMEGAGGGETAFLTKDEALLVAAFRQPRSAPRPLRAGIRRCGSLIGRLLGAGILELVAEEGATRAGRSPERRPRPSSAPGEARRTTPSEMGLQYAIAASHLPVELLARRLYQFNSLPLGSCPGDPPGSPEAFREYTGVDVTLPAPEVGGAPWEVAQRTGWVFFQRGRAIRRPFKVYLCPRPESIAQVLPVLARALAARQDAVFKVAYPAPNLIRADKIVSYLESYEQLQALLNRLVDRLPGVPAQPVPFTAAVDDGGLVSWGVDPPGSASRELPSWRAWITRVIAEEARSGKLNGASGDRVAVLKERLRARQVDPESWLPQQHLLSHSWQLPL